MSLNNAYFLQSCHLDTHQCGGCLNGMAEENIQAHLNDCSQHSSKFICHECGMVSENFLWHMHFFYFQNLFYFCEDKI